MSMYRYLSQIGHKSTIHRSRESRVGAQKVRVKSQASGTKRQKIRMKDPRVPVEVKVKEDNEHEKDEKDVNAET